MTDPKRIAEIEARLARLEPPIHTQLFDDLRYLLEQVEALRDIERKYRERLWLGHGHSINELYGDDGEMQCGKCNVDYKRAPLVEIERAATAARIAMLLAPPEATHGK